MRNYLLDFFREFDYPAEATETLAAAYDTIMACPEAKAIYDEQLEIYNTTDSFMTGKVAEASVLVSRACGVHEYQSQLLIHILFSRHLREIYKKKGYSYELYNASMTDLRIKLFECKAVHGIWGSFVASWFDRFFFCTRFALGRLQFELEDYPADKPPYSSNGTDLVPGTKVVNVHIPSGSRMPHEDVMNAYKLAHEFYKDYRINGNTVFICSSWLLYEKMPEIVGEGTNTYKFVTDYDIIASSEDPGYGDCWRLFEKYYNGDPHDLPADSGMRRSIVEWLAAGKNMGHGFGVIVFDGEKILNK